MISSKILNKIEMESKQNWHYKSQNIRVKNSDENISWDSGSSLKEMNKEVKQLQEEIKILSSADSEELHARSSFNISPAISQDFSMSISSDMSDQYV